MTTMLFTVINNLYILVTDLDGEKTTMLFTLINDLYIVMTDCISKKETAASS